MTKVTFDADRLPALLDILMAGAYADQQLDGREVKEVKELVLGLLKDADELPDSLLRRILAFDPERFDLKKTVAKLGKLTSEQRRAVLEMLSELSEADEEIDLLEDEFLRQVAEEMGSSAEEMKGLTVEVELLSVLPNVRPQPPPVPPAIKKDAK